MDSNYWYRVRVLFGLREVRSSRGDICKPGRHLRMRTKPFAIIAVCAASSVGWQRTTRWMALRRELCVSRKGYSGQISLKPSFPGRLEPTAGSVSPILSKRSARSNSSSWISAIGVCRVNCRTFSAISRQCRAVILRSSLNGMSPRPKRPRMYGVFGSFDIAMPANSPVLRISAIFDGLLTSTGERVAACRFKGARNRLDGPVLRLYWALYKLENMDEREQSTGPIGGDLYREVAGKLREVARECQLPRARQEILDLAERFERRATARDRRAASAGSGRTDSG
jgi:hypothetical protein